MTDVSAKIILHSISHTGKQLASVHMRYPLSVHAEVMTHRVFSRNARSSRAVPVPRMIQEVLDNPVVPIHWGAAQTGMQAYEQTDAMVEVADFYGRPMWLTPEQAWLHARDNAVRMARAFHAAGHHKQNVNRLLAPFLHIDTLVTSSDWDNFLWLRDHHAAEPHMQLLAKQLRKALAESTPTELRPGEWHLPYVTDDDRNMALQRHGTLLSQARVPNERVSELLLKLSVARCARISYAPFDGDASIEAELRRYDLLVAFAPLHASPAEHQATPDTYIDPTALSKQFRRPQLGGNLGPGWVQFRKTLAGENYAAAA